MIIHSVGPECLLVRRLNILPSLLLLEEVRGRRGVIMLQRCFTIAVTVASILMNFGCNDRSRPVSLTAGIATLDSITSESDRSFGVQSSYFEILGNCLPIQTENTCFFEIGGGVHVQGDGRFFFVENSSIYDFNEEGLYLYTDSGEYIVVRVDNSSISARVETIRGSGQECSITECVRTRQNLSGANPCYLKKSNIVDQSTLCIDVVDESSRSVATFPSTSRFIVGYDKGFYHLSRGGGYRCVMFEGKVPENLSCDDDIRQAALSYPYLLRQNYHGNLEISNLDTEDTVDIRSDWSIPVYDQSGKIAEVCTGYELSLECYTTDAMFGLAARAKSAKGVVTKVSSEVWFMKYDDNGDRFRGRIVYFHGGPTNSLSLTDNEMIGVLTSLGFDVYSFSYIPTLGLGDDFVNGDPNDSLRENFVEVERIVNRFQGKAYIVGDSWGGRIALQYAQEGFSSNGVLIIGMNCSAGTSIGRYTSFGSNIRATEDTRYRINQYLSMDESQKNVCDESRKQPNDTIVFIHGREDAASDIEEVRRYTSALSSSAMLIEHDGGHEVTVDLLEQGLSSLEQSLSN